MKKAFTIVELLVVVGILSVLITIVVVAASGVQKAAREKRAEAMRVSLEQGITAYYAQMGKWPQPIESKLSSMTESTYRFGASETDAIFREVVGKAYGQGSGAKSALVDASALFVAKNATGSGKVYGIDFSEAVKKGSRRRISLSEMTFGYPDKETGRFRRFFITYNGKTDSVKVSLQ